jgi:hypothetical protein
MEEREGGKRKRGKVKVEKEGRNERKGAKIEIC